jgi:hypothetical protein
MKHFRNNADFEKVILITPPYWNYLRSSAEISGKLILFLYASVSPRTFLAFVER